MSSKLADQPSLDMEICKTCRHGEFNGDNSQGHCLRYPPQIIGHDAYVVSSEWPKVYEKQKCGEWGRK